MAIGYLRPVQSQSKFQSNQIIINDNKNLQNAINLLKEKHLCVYRGELPALYHPDKNNLLKLYPKMKIKSDFFPLSFCIRTEDGKTLSFLTSQYGLKKISAVFRDLFPLQKQDLYEGFFLKHLMPDRSEYHFHPRATAQMVLRAWKEEENFRDTGYLTLLKQAPVDFVVLKDIRLRDNLFSPHLLGGNFSFHDPEHNHLIQLFPHLKAIPDPFACVQIKTKEDSKVLIVPQTALSQISIFYKNYFLNQSSDWKEKNTRIHFWKGVKNESVASVLKYALHPASPLAKMSQEIAFEMLDLIFLYKIKIEPINLLKWVLHSYNSNQEKLNSFMKLESMNFLYFPESQEITSFLKGEFLTFAQSLLMNNCLLKDLDTICMVLLALHPDSTILDMCKERLKAQFEKLDTTEWSPAAWLVNTLYKKQDKPVEYAEAIEVIEGNAAYFHDWHYFIEQYLRDEDGQSS